MTKWAGKTTFLKRPKAKITFFCLFFLLLSTQLFAATFYISPKGSDSNNGLSQSTPIATFVEAHSKMVGGDTLILMDGIYTEQLYVPYQNSGSAGKYTTFKALNRLKAVIAPTTLEVDQETSGSVFVYSTITNTTSYIEFDGLMVEGLGEHAAISIRSADNVSEPQMSNHIIIKNCGSFGSGLDTNNAGSSISLTRDSLIEDCFFFGFGRYALSNYVTKNVTFRRVVLRFDWWEGDSYKANDPRDGMAFYNAVNGIGENIIVMDMGNRPTSAASGDMNGIAIGGNDTGQAVSGTSNTKLLGSIFLNNHDSTGGGVNGLMLNGGSGAEGTSSSPGDTHDITIKDVVFNDLTSYGLYVYNNIVNVDIDNVTARDCLTGIQVASTPQKNIEGVTIDYSFATSTNHNGIKWVTSDTTPSNISVINCADQSDIEASYAPTISYIPTSTPVIGHERGADVTKRYVDGIKTSTDLWPWPNEDLIKDAMCSSTYLQKLAATINAKEGTSGSYTPGWCATSKSLTAYVWEYAGNTCPSNICDGSSAIIPPVLKDAETN